ncbi:KAT8 regulatory NSL complex subunit 2 [Stomoxys calcitrans]|uniref:KAT8 regulatory NSL complex subunit 2 n=1 Tax=Stomoxys calcitrans TaxID=35570 RepID=A0A1I8PVR7_STOCA|nr:KAT8 regulatory NSL complex subunit 2 [Stomoxys calcitrans]
MSKILPRQCGRGVISNGGGINSEKDLREQVHHEIETKSKICSNPTYECSIPRIDGYDFCIRHILRDPKGNFRQCTYTYSNNKKCTNALPKHDLKNDPNMTTLCFEHNRQVQLQKTHASVGKLKQVDSNDVLLNSLAHHINVEDTPLKNDTNCEQDEEIDVVSPYVMPFVTHDQVHMISDVVCTMRKRKRILDYASDSSTDEEVICMSNTSHGYECNESDNESVDSQDDDLLKHAGIYTRQEAIRISEAKLTKLQGLYIDQINRLHHMLREKRRRYLHAIRREREHLCSIHEQLKESHRERALYDQLKALNSYHRRHGMEAVLYKKFKEKRGRAAAEGVGTKSSFPKCIFTEGGVKCGDRALPCCKYCRKHILEDKKQILFKACEKEKSGVVCQEPIPCILDDSTCVLHLTIPQQKHYVQKKYESETEEEEIGIKTEPLDKSAIDLKMSLQLNALKEMKNDQRIENSSASTR